MNAFVSILALAHAMQQPDPFRKLAACCSTAVSITLLLAGSLFLAFVDPGAARTTRSFAYQLSMLLDQSTRKDVASSLRQAASQNFRSAKSRDLANLKNKFGVAVIPPVASDARSSVSISGSSLAPHAKSPSKEVSRSDVVWLFDQPEGPSLFALSDRGATATGFLIDGENGSNQPLTDVKAVLIPDRNAGNLELALSLRNHSTEEPLRTIPPGAQFSLAYTLSNSLTGSSDAFVEKCGGVIFKFHYTHVGVRKAVIWYLSPSRLRTELRKAGPLASLDQQSSLAVRCWERVGTIALVSDAGRT